MVPNRQLRIGQLNLGGSEVATLELPHIARELNLDLVMIQEQYPPAAAELHVIQTGEKPKAAIYVHNRLAGVAVAHELSNRKPKRDAGYEWWNSKLETARKRTFKLRTVWQKSKRSGGLKEIMAGDAYRAARREYRNLMGVEQSNHFRQVAESGNTDLWGQAYRVASGRIHPPANIINATKYIERRVARPLRHLPEDYRPCCGDSYHG
ncbi:unnamed protein product, partial [Iphiclides podalirius]